MQKNRKVNNFQKAFREAIGDITLLLIVILLVGIVIYTVTNNHGTISGTTSTTVPTATPILTTVPTATPTSVPTATPTTVPTATPTSAPTATPTTVPTATPTSVPTATPTTVPTVTPTSAPTTVPTTIPVKDDVYQLTQIDVGPANAYLVKTEKITIFIDGGNDFNYQTVKAFLDSQNVHKIDILIVTHWHGDHADNANRLIADYNIPVVYGNSVNPQSKFLTTENSKKYSQMLSGNSFNFGNLTLTCVGPYKTTGGENYRSLNLLFQFGERKFLICGDYCYYQTIQDFPELLKNIDVLQFPHHGLKEFCITQKTLIHMNPQFVLVPANTSGPAKNLIKTLKLNVEQVFDGQNGNVTFTTNGSMLSVSTNN